MIEYFPFFPLIIYCCLFHKIFLILIRGNYILPPQNYTPVYTLHSKLFECMFCTLNYDPYYTLHPDIKFTVMLDGNL